MELPRQLKFERLTYEEKYHKAVRGYMKHLCRLYEELYGRFGDEGLDLIRDLSVEYGRSIAENVKKKGALKGLVEVGGYLVKVFDMVSDDWEVTEFSDDRIVIAVRRCPHPFKEEDICAAHTKMEETLVRTLDPDLDHRIGKSIPKGDPCCEHILAAKE